MSKDGAQYDEEMAQEICDAIATGSDGIPTLCEKYPHWPDQRTIYRWRSNHPEFEEKFLVAKRQQCEVLMDEILKIADDDSQDICLTGDGKKFIDHGHINRARLQVDTRKWIAGKLSPRLYGEKKPEEKEEKPQYLMQQIIDKIAKPD